MMMGRLVPLLLALAGLGAGVGGGLVLRPHSAPAEPADHAAPAEHAAEPETDAAHAAPGTHDYVKLNNQFVIPVLESGRVASLVIVSLSLEVTAGLTEAVYLIEPKLRDAFLQVMFDHANAGGFRGTFTDGANLVVLRRALLETAVATMGPAVSDVLIVDIIRQDS